jgi:hypothetical protein
MKIDTTTFTPHPEREGWFVCEAEGDLIELEKQALDINDRRKARGYFAICGCLPGDEQHRLYLVPEHDPVQVARDFEVGAQGDEQKEAIEQIKLVQKQNPIVPFFADSAGFKFKFRKPITEGFVTFLEATLSVGVDEQMLNEDGELNVRETEFVHLWWD